MKKNVYQSPERIFEESVRQSKFQMCEIFVREGKALLLFGRQERAALVGILSESS